MQSILERRLGNDPEFQDIKACQRDAHIAGISSVIIGSGVTFVALKFTKAFESQPKYIPLVCLGVGVCCGYIKSISVVQKYKSMLKRQLDQEQEQGTSTFTSDSVNEPLGKTQTRLSSPQSKYGDESFFMDDKKSK